MTTAVKERKAPVDWKADYESGHYFVPVPGAAYRYDYDRLLWDLDHDPRAQTPKGAKEKLAVFQWYCLNDLFFLGYFGMEITILNHPWLVDRCKEVEGNSNERTMYLWAREHFKSTIISIVKTVQWTLKYPEDAQAIFSHSRPMAQKLLKAIKGYLEGAKLIALFPNVLWADSSKAPSWGLDSGLTVQRRSNRRESTIEAWGLVDAMPTGGHFNRRCVDDLVDPDGVTTPEQINKTREAYRQSHNLGSQTVAGARNELDVIGTPYSYADLYSEIGKDSRYVQSRHTVYGEVESVYLDGRDGVLMTAAQIRDRLIDNGPYIFASQMLLNPTPEGQKKFDKAWVQYYQSAPGLSGLNVYIVGDPANTKKSKSNHNPDYTSTWVFGVAPRGHRYLLDGYYGRYSLPERWLLLKSLVMKWNPIMVGWEQYGKDVEVEHFEKQMDLENFRFDIMALNAPVPKPERIEKWLLPKMYARKWLFPVAIWADDPETNKKVNLIEKLVNDEMLPWPLIRKDDMLDGFARAEDPKLDVQEPRDFGMGVGSSEAAVLAAAGSMGAEVPM